MSHYSPEDRLTIARRIAEMLALPHMACRRRRCRRSGQCWYHFTASKQPCCLNNLNAEQRTIFEEVRADTEHVCGRWGFIMLTQWTSPVTLEMRELAIDIVHSLVGKAGRGRFAEWRRKRALEMMPPPPRPTPPVLPVARPEQDWPKQDWPEMEFEKLEATEPLIRVL